MKLVIIEAIGKIKTVQSATKHIWGRDTQVLATGGYIWTFPNDSIGIDAATLRPNADEQTSKGKYFEREVSRTIGTYREQLDEVILMTDPDREGEGIAAQALRVIHKYHSKLPSSRMYVHDLTVDGIQEAIHTSHLHKGILEAQTARRVLDRLLPLAAAHQLQRGGDFVGLGRVQVAATRIVQDKSSHWKRFLLEGMWKTPQGRFYVREYDEKHEAAQAKLEALKTTALDEYSVQKKTLRIPPPPAFSGQALLAHVINARPDATMAALQAAYMAGRVSYPRTDQTTLGANATRTVGTVIQNLHLGSRLREGWWDSNNTELAPEPLIGAHPALHPTLQWSPTSSKPDDFEARIETEVAARAMASLMTDAIIHREFIAVFTDAGDWFHAVRDTVVEPGWSTVYERLGLQNPLKPKASLQASLPRIVEQLPTPTHVVEWMNDEEIGRPATLAPVPHRLQELNLLSGACVTTRYADALLKDLEKTMMPYTKPAFSRFMENAITSLVEHPEKYNDIVRSVLIEAGTDMASLPTAMSSARPAALEESTWSAAPFDIGL